MSWVRLDDQFADHPKVLRLSSDAFRLHVSAMCYCSAQLTDGRVTPLLTRRLTWFVTDPSQIINELVTAGLWESDGDDYIIHDYLEYNPSADDVRQQRKANADRQAKHRDSKRNTGTNAVSNALRNVPVTASPSPSPNDDEERARALSDLQVLGLFNKTMLDQFDDMWPELSGRRDWIGKAITVARDNNASSPAYALKVLANALHTGKEPGYINGSGATATKPNQLDSSKAVENSRRVKEAAAALAAEGITEDHRLFYPRLNEWIEAHYATG